MNRIASFSINHDALTPGMYVSRIDGDCVTYDLRMKTPNQGDYLEQKGLHTLEHLLATWLRNSEKSSQVIYVGPMGCRTGFYLILRDEVSREEALELVRGAFRFAASFEGDIPGQAAKDCGNYLDMNLAMARYHARKYLVEALETMDEKRLNYPD